MDYKDFTSRNEAYEKFLKLRREVLTSADRGNFGDVFSELCANAMTGDCVAQDVVAYFFNKGVPGLPPENYETATSLHLKNWSLSSVMRWTRLSMTKRS